MVYPRHLHNLKFVFKLSKTDGASKLCFRSIQTAKMESFFLAPILLHFQSQILLFLVYQNYSFGRNSNLEEPTIGWIQLSGKSYLIGCANLSRQTPNLGLTDILGCYPLALALQWIASLKESHFGVLLRNTELHNFYQLGSWLMFCPGSCSWMLNCTYTVRCLP